jgi:hypothetical protein
MVCILFAIIIFVCYINGYGNNLTKWIMYKEMAEKHYKDHKDLPKALAAGIAMDNALKKEYGGGGGTKTHFMMDNFLKYFTYERLPENRAPRFN